MRIVIVYESLFGSTREIAESIGDGVRESDPRAEVTCLRAADADASPEAVRQAGLLVVGGPTHIGRMSSGRTRKMGLQAEAKAAQRRVPEPGAEGPGVRDWFRTLPNAAEGNFAAAFDTRLDGRMAGGAARGIARRLRRHGYDLVAEPTGFIVEKDGPLREGERGRAKEWGARLVRQSVG